MSAAAGSCRKSGEEWRIENLFELAHRKKQTSYGSQLLFSSCTAELSRSDSSSKPVDFGSRVTVQDEIDCTTQGRVERP